MRRWLPWVLLIAGACLLAKSTWSIARFESFQCREFIPPPSYRNTNRAIPASAASDKILGRLEIRRLGLSVLVLEGDDDKSLSLAAGHLPESASLGSVGNAVVAGHRDFAFWPLRRIRRGDKITVHTARTYIYVVQDIRIVRPDDVSVLQSEQGKSTLTLITCYPFRYIGSAPKRYIVRAKMMAG